MSLLWFMVGFVPAYAFSAIFIAPGVINAIDWFMSRPRVHPNDLRAEQREYNRIVRLLQKDSGHPPEYWMEKGYRR